MQGFSEVFTWCWHWLVFECHTVC